MESNKLRHKFPFFLLQVIGVYDFLELITHPLFTFAFSLLWRKMLNVFSAKILIFSTVAKNLNTVNVVVQLKRGKQHAKFLIKVKKVPYTNVSKLIEEK